MSEVGSPIPKAPPPPTMSEVGSPIPKAPPMSEVGSPIPKAPPMSEVGSPIPKAPPMSEVGSPIPKPPPPPPMSEGVGGLKPPPKRDDNDLLRQIRERGGKQKPLSLNHPNYEHVATEPKVVEKSTGQGLLGGLKARMGEGEERPIEQRLLDGASKKD